MEKNNKIWHQSTLKNPHLVDLKQLKTYLAEILMKIKRMTISKMCFIKH